MGPVHVLDVNWLFASLIWGSVGVGCFIYGKRQQSIVPLMAGIMIVAVSYFAESALSMSLYCLGLMAVAYLLLRNGY